MDRKGWTPSRTNESIIGDLVEELRKNQSEGSYYHGWKANIAMAFQDEFSYSDNYCDDINIHKLSNDAADRFLQQLIAHNE